MSRVLGPCRAALAAVILIGAALAAALPAGAVELRLSHFMSRQHIMYRGLLEPWAAAVAKATHGAVRVRIFSAGEMGTGARSQYSRAIDGIVDIAFGVQGYTSAQFPGTLLIELPGVAPTSAEATRMLWRGLKGPLAREYRRVKVLGLFTNAPALIMTREKPVRRLEDMTGLKIRVASAQSARIVEAWGASPVSMAGSEVYLALQTGVIDGVMMGASGIVPFRLTEVARYYTHGLPLAVSAFFVVANRASWARLTPADRDAVDRLSGLPFSLKANRLFLEDATQGLARVKGDARLELIELDATEVARFRAAAERVWQQAAAALKRRQRDAAGILNAMTGHP